jgi:hypothetical protein
MSDHDDDLVEILTSLFDHRRVCTYCTGAGVDDNGDFCTACDGDGIRACGNRRN